LVSSAGDVAARTTFVLFKYRWMRTFPNAVPAPCFSMNGLSAASSFGLFLRTPHAMSPSARRTMFSWTVRFGTICVQNLAT
jgi:hypothetical protein